MNCFLPQVSLNDMFHHSNYNPKVADTGEVTKDRISACVGEAIFFSFYDKGCKRVYDIQMKLMMQIIYMIHPALRVIPYNRAMAWIG